MRQLTIHNMSVSLQGSIIWIPDRRDVMSGLYDASQTVGTAKRAVVCS